MLPPFFSDFVGDGLIGCGFRELPGILMMGELSKPLEQILTLSEACFYGPSSVSRLDRIGYFEKTSLGPRLKQLCTKKCFIIVI